MIVRELLQRLAQYEPNTIVTIACFETGGYIELVDIEPVELAFNDFQAGASYYPAHWVETADGRAKPAICLGPKDPSLFPSHKQLAQIRKNTRTKSPQ